MCGELLPRGLLRWVINLGHEGRSNSRQCRIGVFIIPLLQSIHDMLSAIGKDHAPRMSLIMLTLFVTSDVDGYLQFIVGCP